MTGYEFFSNYWWVFPLVMIILCIFFLKKGCSRMMCRFHTHNDTLESAIEILNKRYAKGDIEQEEYEEKKKKLV